MFCGLLIGGFANSHAVGAESVVQAIVCREGASLAISQPMSDSVVTTPGVALEGDVAQATQIEVTIDGQFNGVVPLNAAATTFTATVQLSPGTHTIQLTAVDACQIENATDSVVVTYQAPDITSPSVGSQTATDVPAGGVVIGENASLGRVELIGQTAFERAVQPLVELGRSLDLIDRPQRATGAELPQMVRFSLVVAGLVSIVFSAQIATFLHSLKRGAFHSRISRRIAPIGLGVVMLLFAFTL